MCWIPKVTTSKDEFIEYICKVCEAKDIGEEIIEDWVWHVWDNLYQAHYFYGMIYVCELRPYFLLHELVHHIAQLLRKMTHSKKWYSLDYIIDTVDKVIP